MEGVSRETTLPEESGKLDSSSPRPTPIPIWEGHLRAARTGAAAGGALSPRGSPARTLSRLEGPSSQMDAHSLADARRPDRYWMADALPRAQAQGGGGAARPLGPGVSELGGHSTLTHSPADARAVASLTPAAPASRPGPGRRGLFRPDPI